jgi:glycine hydroxymethyltransferase
MDSLRRDDPGLADLLEAEVQAQRTTLAMISYASLAAPSVRAAEGSALSNVAVEGYPGVRYHPGAARFDEVERLAVERAKYLFGARYANVQPHSCSSANLTTLAALVPPGGTLLGLSLDEGGHLTHGAPASVSGRHYRAVYYGLDSAGRIDYEQVAEAAAAYRPDVVIAGASAYPRRLDYNRFRAIADSVGAYLIADISQISGLVAAGEHPNPIDVAHITTTCTYKQLGGPHGGLILCGVEHESTGPDGQSTLARLLQRAVFPRTQGTPSPAAIAAKARALALASEPEFKRTMRLVVADAAALAAGLAELGYRILTGGTDNHMVVADLRERGLTGVIAERALEECGILANRNRIPCDVKPPLVASGLRMGTNILAQRGIGPGETLECARLVHAVLAATTALGDTGYRIDPVTAAEVRAAVSALCERYPVPADRALVQ